MRLLKTPEEVAARDRYGKGLDYFAKWTGPPLTVEMVKRAEAALGVGLPQAYLDLLREQNGGFLRRPIGGDEFPLEFAVSAISGIGYPYGIDSDQPIGGRYMCREWEYPAGLVYLDGDGHTGVMLDYRECGAGGDPPVVWLDTETGDGPETKVIAPNFERFLAMLGSVPPHDESA